MLAIKRSVDRPIIYQSIFQYFSFWKTLWVYPVIFAVLSCVAEIAMNSSLIKLIVVLASLFFAISYFMFIPLVVEKKLSSWQALETSRKTISQHWFKMLWLVIFFTLIVIVSMMTAGIALIWTMPWIYCVMGILYREMFGVEKI